MALELKTVLHQYPVVYIISQVNFAYLFIKKIDEECRGFELYRILPSRVSLDQFGLRLWTCFRHVLASLRKRTAGRRGRQNTCV